MAEWFKGNDNDPRFTEIMNLVEKIEKTVPEKQREGYYADLRDSMEIKRKQWRKRKTIFGFDLTVKI